MYGKRQASYENIAPIRHGNDYIPFKYKTIILGVTFDSNLTFNYQISNKIKLAKVARAKLYRFESLN